jgi:hypothetical protein
VIGRQYRVTADGKVSEHEVDVSAPRHDGHSTAHKLQPTPDVHEFHNTEHEGHCEQSKVTAAVQQPPIFFQSGDPSIPDRGRSLVKKSPSKSHLTRSDTADQSQHLDASKSPHQHGALHRWIIDATHHMPHTDVERPQSQQESRSKENDFKAEGILAEKEPDGRSADRVDEY